MWLSRFHSKSITSSFALYALCRKILFIQLLFTSREALSACLMLCCSYLILYRQLLPKSLLEVPVWFELQSYQEVRKYKIKTQQVLWVCVVNLGDLLANYRCDTEPSHGNLDASGVVAISPGWRNQVYPRVRSSIVVNPGLWSPANEHCNQPKLIKSSESHKEALNRLAQYYK